MPATYDLVVVDRWGSRLAELVNYDLGDLAEKRNRPDEFSFDMEFFGNVVLPTNLVPDPSFENGLSGWVIPAAFSRAQDQKHHGKTSLRFSTGAATTASATSPLAACKASQSYTFSLFARNSLSAGTFNAVVRQYASDAVTLLSSVTVAVPANAAFTRYTAGFTSHASAAFFRFDIVGDVANGNFWADALQLEEGSIATLFVEGEGGQVPRVLQDEVQVWRNNKLHMWGVVAAAKTDKDKLNVQCTGVMGLMARRHFGKAKRTNLLSDPSFESGGATWLNSPVEPPTSRTIMTNRKIDGDQSIQLTAPSDNDAYIYQQVNVTPGERYTFAAHFFIRTDAGATPFTYPAHEQRGIMLVRFDNNQAVEVVTYPISFEAPRGRWEREQLDVAIPSDAGPSKVECRLYAPNCTILWDAISFTFEERTEFLETDQGLIVQSLTQHSQDGLFNKTTMNIDCPAVNTGVLRTKTYFHHDHGNIFDALSELTELSNGVDIHMEYVEGNPWVRNLRVSYPKKGGPKPALTLEMGRNISKFDYIVDGRETAQSITMLGLGEGSARDEAGVFDSNAMNGLGLEMVETAAPYASIDSLTEQAIRKLSRRKTTVRIPSVTSYPEAEELIMGLFLGDTVPVIIDYGWVQEVGTYEVVGRTVDPNTDSVRYDLNPVA